MFTKVVLTLSGEQYVIIEIGSEEYAISIEHVIEVVRIDTIKKVLKAPAFLEGLISIRGQVIPLVNLNLYFNASFIKEIQTSVYALIVELNGDLVAFCVDKICEVKNLGNIKKTPQLMRVPFINGIFNLSDRIILKLDLEQMFEGRTHFLKDLVESFNDLQH